MQIPTRYKRCSQRKRRVANWFDNCCHCFVAKVYPINVTQAHWHHTMECRCSSYRTVLILEQLTKWYLSEYCSLLNLITCILWPRNEVKMRLRLNLKTACTTTMPPQFIDMIYWGVSAVVLVLMLLTKWYPSEYWSLKNVTIYYVATR